MNKIIPNKTMTTTKTEVPPRPKVANQHRLPSGSRRAQFLVGTPLNNGIKSCPGNPLRDISTSQLLVITLLVKIKYQQGPRTRHIIRRCKFRFSNDLDWNKFNDLLIRT